MIKNYPYEGWILFSNRFNSINYKNQDETRLLKLDTTPGAVISKLEYEHSINDRLIEIGIPTPKIIDCVEMCDGKIGTVYEYIKSKRSVSRAISIDINEMEDACRRFAEIGRKMHSTACDKDYFPDIHEKILMSLNKADYFTLSQRKYLLGLVSAADNPGTCLHGDFQFSNVIMSDLGDYAIDLEHFGYGNPLFDLGLMYLFAYDEDEARAEKSFHLKQDVLHKICTTVMKYYTGRDGGEEFENMKTQFLPYGVAMFSYHLDGKNDDVLKEYLCRVMRSIGVN